MKIDLHCHTHFSDDGISSVEKMLLSAKRKGLDGIAITDHNTCRSWDEAKKASEKLQMHIIFGQEIKSKQGDILGLFLQKEIPGKGKEAEWVLDEIHKQGGIAVLPHPFSIYERFKGDVVEYARKLDGIEVLNARRNFDDGDKKALDFAQKYNLAQCGGSDGHQAIVIGTGYTEVLNAKNLEEFKNGIIMRQSRAGGQKMSAIFIALSQSKKWFCKLFPFCGKN